MKKLEHVYLSIEENRDGILLHLQDTIPVLRKRERGSYTAGRMTGQMRYDRILHGERDENGQVSHRVGEINYAPAIPVQGTRYCLYQKLKDESADLDEKIMDNLFFFRISASDCNEHDTLFYLKSLDLDRRMGYELGTIYECTHEN